jgi:hypothetical protein
MNAGLAFFLADEALTASGGSSAVGRRRVYRRGKRPEDALRHQAGRRITVTDQRSDSRHCPGLSRY